MLNYTITKLLVISFFLSNSSKCLHFRIYFYILMCLKTGWNHQLLLFSKYDMSMATKKGQPQSHKDPGQQFDIPFCFHSLNWTESWDLNKLRHSNVWIFLFPKLANGKRKQFTTERRKIIKKGKYKCINWKIKSCIYMTQRERKNIHSVSFPIQYYSKHKLYG